MPKETERSYDYAERCEIGAPVVAKNACAHFGGVPETLVIVNLKAAVAHPDWFDPLLTPKVQSFAQHYTIRRGATYALPPGSG